MPSSTKSIPLFIVALLLGTAANAGATEVSALIKAAVAKNQQAAAAQARVDASSDATADLLSEFRSTEKQKASVQVYNDQLDKLLASQQAELESLRMQIDRAVVIQHEITPLMLKMIDGLEKFVALDVPFLKEERDLRVKALHEAVGRADVSESEKFRRLLEAYQIENEFGRTIEAYQGNLDLNGQNRTVDFLRIGRLALIYITLDQRETGAWDQETRAWKQLPTGDHRSAIVQALRVARKQTAPDLLRLPLPAAKEAK